MATVQTAPQLAAKAIPEGIEPNYAAHSDVASPAAGEIINAATAELHRVILQNGPTPMRIEMEDGTVLNSDAEVLNYLEELAQFAIDVHTCQIGAAA